MKIFSPYNVFCLAAIMITTIVATEYDPELMRQKEEQYTEIECNIELIAVKESADESNQHASHPHIPGPRSLRASNNFSTSTNWAGYAAATKLSSPKKNSVSAVSGTWIVPTIQSTPDDSFCAIWVGIDGYGSPTVEQIGTEHDWSSGAQQDYAWFEMYPGGSYLINGFPLNPGDVISASVVYSGNSIFTLKIYNDTQQVFVTIPTQYTKSSVAARSSAEWIVEAPYLNGILPLSDFGTIYLWGCTANIQGSTAPIKNSKWQNTGIQMVTDNGTPKATPSTLLPDGGSFFVTWNHE
jgi:hypothetical protein